MLKNLVLSFDKLCFILSHIINYGSSLNVIFIPGPGDPQFISIDFIIWIPMFIRYENVMQHLLN